MEIKIVKVVPPKEVNLIIGQSHFIESVENLYEAIVHSTKAKFGIAFVEASGECLIRHEGNDSELEELASKKAFEIGAGHIFLIFLKEAYPINVLNAIKNVPEVVNIYCATANPVEVIVGETQQGRSILGVVDGFLPKGIENENNKKERREFLRRIGYKF
ncbi:MAG: adenosine-specific kinase [Candidatus Micrarchaeia archaeon]|jgi:adenosine/AMP kinase